MIDKKPEKVGEMFDRIAGTYDRLNKILSMGIDRRWRKKVIEEARKIPHRRILDVASGTGDLSLLAARLKPDEIIAADISRGMLSVQNRRIRKKNLNTVIKTIQANAEELPFPENSFDLATCAFGVRNFENPETGLKEIHRVLKPGGSLLILEFSKPTGWFGHIFKWYFKKILPGLGYLVSGHSGAYQYLFDTVQEFPDGSDFLKILMDNGYRETSLSALTWGVATLYKGKKKAAIPDSLH